MKPFWNIAGFDLRKITLPNAWVSSYWKNVPRASRSTLINFKFWSPNFPPSKSVSKLHMKRWNSYNNKINKNWGENHQVYSHRPSPRGSLSLTSCLISPITTWKHWNHLEIRQAARIDMLWHVDILWSHHHSRESQNQKKNTSFAPIPILKSRWCAFFPSIDSLMYWSDSSFFPFYTFSLKEVLHSCLMYPIYNLYSDIMQYIPLSYIYSPMTDVLHIQNNHGT